MRQFIIKITLLVSICLSVAIIVIQRNNELFSDMNYNKFKSKHKSLVLGTSRAKFAVNPSVFQEKYDLFNFAFTTSTSPYGQVYYEAMQEKLTNESGAIFILDIDPYSLSASKKDSNNISNEKKNSLGRQFIMNGDPNYEYILKNETPLYDPLFPIMKSNTIKCENGFTKIASNFTVKEDANIRRETINSYIESSKNNIVSYQRIAYLEKTIEFLKRHGKVYLVSVPVSSSINLIQQKYWPDNEQFNLNLAKKHKVQYFNFQKIFPNPKTVDGVHLLLEEAEKLSIALRDSIARYQK